MHSLPIINIPPSGAFVTTDETTLTHNNHSKSIVYSRLHTCNCILVRFGHMYNNMWEKAMASHSSTLAWRIPWMGEPGGLQSMGSLRDTTERLHFHFSLSCIGEGNGNPLQCSCLENPRGRGAWWADIYGVAQSRTRLKWLSSSSSMITCIHYYRYHREWFHCPKNPLCPPIHPSLTQSLATPDLFYCLHSFDFSKCHIIGVIHYVAFQVFISPPPPSSPFFFSQNYSKDSLYPSFGEKGLNC